MSNNGEINVPLFKNYIEYYLISLLKIVNKRYIMIPLIIIYFNIIFIYI